MPVRDRFEEFQAQRELLTKSDKKSGKGDPKMDGGGKTLQSFLADASKIESDLSKMKEDVSEIKKLQQDMLSTPFCEQSNVVKYEAMGEQIRHDAMKIGGALKQLEKKFDSKKIGEESALSRVRTQQLNTLTTELNLATNEYYKTQAEYMDKMKARLRRQLSARGDNSADDDKINTILEQDSYSVFTQNYISETQDAEQTLRDLEDRKNDILALEKSVTDVNQLFKDLNLIVATQGETLVRIEDAVENTEAHVEGGKQQLKKAREHQSRARRKKFCICGIILCVLLVIGIIIAIILSQNS